MFWREIKEWLARSPRDREPETRKVEPSPIRDEVDADRDAVRTNPGNGWRVVRLIMKASTVEEVEALHEDFRAAARRTCEIEVTAAYWLKRARLLDYDDESHWWAMVESMEEGGDDAPDFLQAVGTAISKLDEEYPQDARTTSGQDSVASGIDGPTARSKGS